MIGPRASAGLVAMVLGLFASGPAWAGSVYFSHSVHLPPRVEAANIALYERDVARRDRAPEAFDHRQPLVGHILSDPAVYREMLARWEDHPWTFEHHHRELWRVLDGEMLWHQHQGDPLAGLGHDGGLSSLPFPFTPPMSGDRPPIGPQGAGPGVPTVPEPASGILMIVGLLAGAVVRRLHRDRALRDRI